MKRLITIAALSLVSATSWANPGEGTLGKVFTRLARVVPKPVLGHLPADLSALAGTISPLVEIDQGHGVRSKNGELFIARHKGGLVSRLAMSGLEQVSLYLPGSGHQGPGWSQETVTVTGRTALHRRFWITPQGHSTDMVITPGQLTSDMASLFAEAPWGGPASGSLSRVIWRE